MRRFAAAFFGFAALPAALPTSDALLPAGAHGLERLADSGRLERYGGVPPCGEPHAEVARALTLWRRRAGR